MSENITPEEDWLECFKMDGGFGILNDDEIVSSVTTLEKDEIDDDEGPVLNQKPRTSHSEARTMLSKCIDWFEM
ncbi:hypothetical protein AVEN_223551-1 [Araneus ventricosus]|uniref:DDE-1 domain-containing protein n=1 Tax=Araneus ventricosus TaxID=182803 RepID=A0A4Y2RW19_ARAVE|nr:hypothetical protein AVEN_223551-1 [Araneus ventricosus]